MEEWLDDTIRGIAALEPRRTLEIGCGTGMILFRIAPRCEAYTGIDVSGRALRYIESQLGRVGLDDGRVRLLRKSAHELDGFAADSFDTVVVNSVAQYFPSADYLAEVVERAVELVRPGGADLPGRPAQPAAPRSVPHLAGAVPGRSRDAALPAAPEGARPPSWTRTSWRSIPPSSPPCGSGCRSSDASRSISSTAAPTTS